MPVQATSVRRHDTFADSSAARVMLTNPTPSQGEQFDPRTLTVEGFRPGNQIDLVPELFTEAAPLSDYAAQLADGNDRCHIQWACLCRSCRGTRRPGDYGNRFIFRRWRDRRVAHTRMFCDGHPHLPA